MITFLGSWFLGMPEVRTRSLQSEGFEQHGVRVVERGVRASVRDHRVKRLIISVFRSIGSVLCGGRAQGQCWRRQEAEGEALLLGSSLLLFS